VIVFYTGVKSTLLGESYVEVAEVDVVELDDVDTVIAVVEVVGRAFTTAHSVAHNITENFICESRKVSNVENVLGIPITRPHGNSFIQPTPLSRLFSIIPRNSSSRFVIAIHLPR